MIHITLRAANAARQEEWDRDAKIDLSYREKLREISEATYNSTMISSYVKTRKEVNVG